MTLLYQAIMSLDTYFPPIQENLSATIYEDYYSMTQAQKYLRSYEQLMVNSLQHLARHIYSKLFCCKRRHRNKLCVIRFLHHFKPLRRNL